MKYVLFFILGACGTAWSIVLILHLVSSRVNPNVHVEQFYQGNIHYLVVRGRVINYTSDSIDYESEVDTTGESYPVIIDTPILNHSQIKK